MSNPIEIPGFGNPTYTGKQTCLPPKSPRPAMPTSYIDYTVHNSVGTIGTPKPREGYRHQRSSSESIIVEEQPSWLDDLLNEPETPVGRGTHRRATSDSFAYVDTSNLSSNFDNLSPEGYNHHSLKSKPSWDPGEFDSFKGIPYHHSIEADSFGRHQNRGKDLNLNSGNYGGSSHLSVKNKTMHPNLTSTVNESTEQNQIEQNQKESAQDVNGSPGKGEGSHARQTQTQTDIETKRVKQQFAQRSRVRKLQYIAELERTVHSLQAEGMGISAEIEFLGQQNLILNMENKALKQRFDSLSQEHLIKSFEQEMWEREIGRLRAFFHHQHQQQHQQQQQQQQQPQQQRHQQCPNSNHSRSNSRDLDQQFANLSLKHKDANSGRDQGPLHI